MTDKGDLISREALKEHKFVGNKFVQIGGRNNGKTLESINKAYQQGWNDCIDAIIDNAPTIDLKDIYQEGHYDGHLEGYTKAINEERPKGEWIRTALYGETCYECNKCNRHQTHITKFCPNCGADMRGKQP